MSPHDGGPRGSSSNSSEGGVGLRARIGSAADISGVGRRGAGAGGGAGDVATRGLALRLGEVSGDEFIVLRRG